DVISTSRTESPPLITEASGTPICGSPGSTQMPCDSSLNPSSRSEQIIPSDSTPRIFDLRSLVPSGSLLPICATATFCPAATFGAPHTIESRAGPPMSTEQRLRRSALGCWPLSTTWPTTIAGSNVTPRSTDSTGSPRVARSCSSSSGEPARSPQSASQFQVTFTRSSELGQEADVVREEIPEVGHAVAEHDEPLHARAKGESGPALRIVSDFAEHVRMHHSRPQNLEPSARQGAAHLASLPAAEEATDVDDRAGLDERIVRGTEADLRLRAEELLQELVQRSFEVGHADVLVHVEPFDLVELKEVRRVHRLVPVHAPRADDSKGRLGNLHGADLDGGGVRPEDDAFVLEVERVGGRARGMSLRHVERAEAVP